MTFKNPFHLSDIPELFVLAIIFLIPFQTRWITISGTLNSMHWEYGTISVYALDFIIALFICVTLFAHALHRTPKPFTLTHVLALFLLVIAFFSTDFAGNKLSALFWCTKLAEGIALFFCVSHTRLHLTRVAWAFAVAGLIQTGLALWQFTTQHVFHSTLLGMSAQDPQTLGVQVVETIAGRTLRAYGSLPHPNMLGGFLVISILATLILLFIHRKLLHRTLLALMLTVQSYALMATFSRQAWIGLSVALVVMVIFAFLRERTFPGIVVVGILAIIVPMLAFSAQYHDLVATRTSTATRLEEKSVDERETYIEQSEAILRDHWFAGVGIGNDTAYLHAQDRRQGLFKAGSSYQPVHNIYLLAFVELGIFGLAAFVFFLLSLFFQSKWKTPPVVIWSLGIISLAVIGVFDHYLWSLHFGIMLFWLVAGILTQARMHETQRESATLTVEKSVLTQ